MSDDPGVDFLSTQQLAEKYPVGDDPETAWYRLLAKLCDEELLRPGHWRMKRSTGTSHVKVYHEPTVLRIIGRKVQEKRCPPFLQMVVLYHKEKICNIGSKVKTA